MTEAWAEPDAQATADVVLQNAYSLLTEEVWALAALLLIGMLVGMATVGAVRTFLPGPRDSLPAYEQRALLLKRLGAGSAGLWTAGIQFAYLTTSVGLDQTYAVLTALGAGVLAAGGNHQAFKPVKAIWGWALARLSKKIEQDTGGPAPDLSATITMQPHLPPDDPGVKPRKGKRRGFLRR